MSIERNEIRIAVEPRGLTYYLYLILRRHTVPLCSTFRSSLSTLKILIDDGDCPNTVSS